MNIKEAKVHIENTVKSYLAKDKFGNYRLPVQNQRPVFVVGPPGVGKTESIHQVALENNLNFLSYSMPHHTKQSASGLPIIRKASYGGSEYEVTEYTMSEIIAEIYKAIETSGVKEGILLLDEINCVSELLHPTMLCFLQYKRFGCYQIPEGWVIIAAGNPLEFNDSAHEFDIVTLDRLCQLDVTADYKTWREYAINENVHPAVITFLDTREEDFYRVENSVDGKLFVTARGWFDLSLQIKLYEESGIPVGPELIKQFIRVPAIANRFAAYYELFNKYKSDYEIDSILDGSVADDIRERAKVSEFDERVSLLGLIFDALAQNIKEAWLDEKTLMEFKKEYLKINSDLNSDIDAIKTIRSSISDFCDRIDTGKKTGNITKEDQYIWNSVIEILDYDTKRIIDSDSHDATVVNSIIKEDFSSRVNRLKESISKCKAYLNNAYSFMESVWGNGNELLIFTTQIASNKYISLFIGTYGCEKYFDHSKDLIIYDRAKEIKREIKDLDLN